MILSFRSLEQFLCQQESLRLSLSISLSLSLSLSLFSLSLSLCLFLSLHQTQCALSSLSLILSSLIAVSSTPLPILIRQYLYNCIPVILREPILPLLCQDIHTHTYMFAVGFFVFFAVFYTSSSPLQVGSPKDMKKSFPCAGETTMIRVKQALPGGLPGAREETCPMA